MNRDLYSSVAEPQLPLFESAPDASASSGSGGSGGSGGIAGAAVVSQSSRLTPPVLRQSGFVNPHLRTARRLSRRIRRLPDHSPEETQTGLAICRALKAYLDDQADRTH